MLYIPTLKLVPNSQQNNVLRYDLANQQNPSGSNIPEKWWRFILIYLSLGE